MSDKPSSRRLQHADSKLLGLPPVAAPDARILVLGSFPGVASLAGAQYYGNPRNHFWQLVSSALGTSSPLEYQARLDWLMQNRIALWDVVASCVRRGSLDQNISDACYNDIQSLLLEHDSITTILLNGSKAASLFRRFVAPGLVQSGRSFSERSLPSSSPVPSRQYRNMEDKREAWFQGFKL